MTELKTLKDLDIFKTYKKLLKQEAIKRIKKLQSDHPYESGDEVLNMDQYIKGQIDWITQFFNLTEKDL
ncbi:hypothetical protein LCGC14_2757950, partial [marine sediment metagenome]